MIYKPFAAAVRTVSFRESMIHTNVGFDCQ